MAESSSVKPTKTSSKKQPKKDDIFPASMGPPRDNHICRDCDNTVTASQQDLQCDCCEGWFHSGCEKVSAVTYDFLSKHAEEKAIFWFCNGCETSYRKIITTVVRIDNAQKQLDDKVEAIKKTLDSKVHDIDNIVANQQRTEDKIDVFMASMTKKGDKIESVEVNQKRMEDKVDALITWKDNTCKEPHDKTAQGTQKHVEEKMNEIINTVKNQSKIDGHYVHSCVEDAVKIKMNMDQQEEEEIKKRRHNVILHGLAESAADSADDRWSHDESQVLDLLHDIQCDDVSIDKIIRLGKRPDDQSAKPRPLMLVASSEDQKDKILRCAKNLRGRRDKGLQPIFLHQDLTPNQRAARKLLIQELNDRKSQGEQNLIIINGKITQRRAHLSAARATQGTSS